MTTQEELEVAEREVIAARKRVQSAEEAVTCFQALLKEDLANHKRLYALAAQEREHERLATGHA
jgi:hypothetical protein